ncbi:MAG: threonine--tRNA ligase [Candidatus Freyarchaeota archaeon]|nr:threonine--tRNA ligase [Candidatus Freyrarchaeum guaymaensis]
MRMLLIHADEFSYAVTKATPIAEEVGEEAKKGSSKECLVVFSAVERGDEKNVEDVAGQAVEEIRKVAEQVGARNIVVYPYAHLSSNLSDPDTAVKVLKRISEKLSESYSVVRAPFGYYKSFNLSCKGHPLSELSREVKPREEARRVKAEKEFLVVTPNGEELSPEEYVAKAARDEFAVLVEREALGRGGAGSEKEPEFISMVKKFQMNWEDFSDRGHMRFGPAGDLLFSLVSDYSSQIVRDLGIPVYFVRGTNMFDLAKKPVREHAELFGDRLYQVEVENRRYVLRYAACHQQFSMLKDWTISYRNLPFGVFEVADSYRLEQSGELLLCFRTRKLHMPDLHVICRDEKEAWEWFHRIHERIFKEMDELGRNYEMLVNLTSKEFYRRNKEEILKLAKSREKNILICFYPPGVNYYWSINVEYHILDDLERPREIGTVQIDFGNSRRFGIKYVDADGEERYPFILHTAIIGTVERYLYTLFDTAVKRMREGKAPMLPVWLSPVQVRIIPVAERHMEYAEKLAEDLKEFRVDVDDRDETVGRKVRQAEEEWVPYVVVVGDKEAGGGKLTVRVREEREEVEMTVEELKEHIRREVKGKPFRPLPYPRRLSQRPVFAA